MDPLMRIRKMYILSRRIMITISINLKPMILYIYTNLKNTIDFNRRINFTRDLHPPSFHLSLIIIAHNTTLSNLQNDPLYFHPRLRTTILHQFQTSLPTIDRRINPREEKLKASFVRTKILPSPRYRFLDHPFLTATKRPPSPLSYDRGEGE